MELDNIPIASQERDLYRAVVQGVEKQLIEKVLDRTFGNKLKAAKILGMNRNTLHSKIRKFGIDVKRFKI